MIKLPFLVCLKNVMKKIVIDLRFPCCTSDIMSERMNRKFLRRRHRRRCEVANFKLNNIDSKRLKDCCLKEIAIFDLQSLVSMCILMKILGIFN